MVNKSMHKISSGWVDLCYEDKGVESGGRGGGIEEVGAGSEGAGSMER